jgi:hypothetical protein
VKEARLQLLKSFVKPFEKTLIAPSLVMYTGERSSFTCEPFPIQSPTKSRDPRPKPISPISTSLTSEEPHILRLTTARNKPRRLAKLAQQLRPFAHLHSSHKPRRILMKISRASLPQHAVAVSDEDFLDVAAQRNAVTYAEPSIGAVRGSHRAAVTAPQ